WRQAGSAIEAGRVDLKGERKEMTYFFCDMSGFTSYSEEADPEDVISTVNEYFEAAVAIIHGENGDIERFMGDGFLAIFEESSKAGRAALLCTRKFREIGELRRERGQEAMEFRIGLHTGVGVRGSVGGPERKEFTVMGDAVNTASRLESLCTPGRILVSDDFVKTSPERFLIGERFEIKMKGKSHPLCVSYLKGIRPASVEPSEPMAFPVASVTAVVSR
ncbi:MAG: adenylate/guanylate cyclase domain-containing protein, partial [Leptospiraceae bacterium]|nr:adenylate/guanylate cyclase domain-containing protein [Leptospiraceae bacterium]